MMMRLFCKILVSGQLCNANTTRMKRGNALPTAGPYAAAANVKHAVEFTRQKNSLKEKFEPFETMMACKPAPERRAKEG